MTYNPASHNDTISINIALSALPATRQGFSTVLLLVPLASNSLNSQRSATYSSITEATAANTAGYISATTLGRITTLFAQRDNFGRSPARVIVHNVDLAGDPAETYSAAYNLAVGAGLDFYGVCIEARTNTEILDLAAAVETTDRHLLAVVNADSGWLTSGVPAALTALAAYERTVLYYHDVATAYVDVGHFAARLMADPDVTSAPWRGEVLGVAGLSTSITQTQKAFLRENNINVGLPFGNTDFFIDPGYNARGRPVYELVTRDWLRARIEEDLAQEIVAHEKRLEKFIVGPDGVAKFSAIVEARLEQGERVDHFVVGQTTINSSTTSVATESITLGGAGQRATSARLFNFNFEISADPVVVEV